MENTILTGEVVLVNKLSYGPRLPESPSEIPLINIFYYIKASFWKRNNLVKWHYKRLNGFSDIKYNDIVIFNRPGRKKEIYIKRCVALPGDTISIQKAKVYINDIEQHYPEKIKLQYHLYTKNILTTRIILDSLNIRYFKNDLFHQENFYDVRIDKNQFKEINNSSYLDSLKRYIECYNIVRRPFVKSENLKWSIDFFGPMKIPKKSMKIKLTYENYIKYSMAIRKSEGKEIKYNNGNITINGKPKDYYIFENDYYFMMGDNRYDSKDSRYIGLIPEEMIIGRTRRILFSYHKEKFKWYRIFRKLR